MTTLIPKYSQVTTANRTIAEKFGETVSVKDYGATGDGTTDDTAAINAAITALSSSYEAAQGLYFPAGIYRVTSTINITLTYAASLTLYSRQQYIFLPLIHFVCLLFYNKNIKIIGLIGLLYLLFSLPGFYTLYLWGTFSDYTSVHALNYVSYQYILKNLFVILSIIFFYSLPLLFIHYQYFKKELINKLFVYRFIILFSVLSFFIFNIEYSSLGGGVFLKFTQFFLNKNYILLAFLSSFIILLLFVILCIYFLLFTIVIII
jgi:hypothetical protein